MAPTAHVGREFVMTTIHWRWFKNPSFAPFWAIYQNINNLNFLVKSRPARTTTLTDFENFHGLLYAQLSCISDSNLTWFASQVTELLRKPRVGQLGRIFPCTLQEKNYALDRKIDELYHHAQFGKIVQRAPAVGAKMGVSFFLFFFCCVDHAPSPEHYAVEGCIIVRTSIALPFIGRFRRGLQRFHRMIALWAALHSSHTRR